MWKRRGLMVSLSHFYCNIYDSWFSCCESRPLSIAMMRINYANVDIDPFLLLLWISNFVVISYACHRLMIWGQVIKMMMMMTPRCPNRLWLCGWLVVKQWWPPSVNRIHRMHRLPRKSLMYHIETSSSFPIELIALHLFNNHPKTHFASTTRRQ